MTSRRHKSYLRRMFDGEDGDLVKKLLTDGKWKPDAPYGESYEPDTIGVKILGTVFLIILFALVVAVGFGAWKLLVWMGWVV